MGDTDIKAQQNDGVNSTICKTPSMFTLTNVIKVNACIYHVDNKKKNKQENRKKELFG
ncbi:hypothetical protein [Enterobacter sp. UNJFSC 003]|uniref:hypothetical protein n=1 Tax=Enterobacter sp. UNJFSC 003 TaxID=3122077 RepID=UPI002E9A7959|nr:hypothetical protein [Serratia liquefaciens]